jgi:hypothetical protein
LKPDRDLIKDKVDDNIMIKSKKEKFEAAKDEEVLQFNEPHDIDKYLIAANRGQTFRNEWIFSATDFVSKVW